MAKGQMTKARNNSTEHPPPPSRLLHCYSYCRGRGRRRRKLHSATRFAHHNTLFGSFVPHRAAHTGWPVLQRVHAWHQGTCSALGQPSKHLHQVQSTPRIAFWLSNIPREVFQTTQRNICKAPTRVALRVNHLKHIFGSIPTLDQSSQQLRNYQGW